jgi:hypothetical protein
MFGILLSGCAVVGPASVRNGRSTYNAVINQTEDEQILAMIVRQRYDETFGMLAVSGVTASLRISASFGANAGVGSSSGYEGNLVPLSAGAVYEENPTISYVPLRGEQFLQRMLAPISAEQALLLSRMSTDEVEVLRFLVRRANGLANPLYSSRPADAGFDRFLELYSRLREAGKLDIVQSSGEKFELLLHDYTEDQSRDVDELLRTLGVKKAREPAAPITLPLRFFVGSPQPDSLDLETPSALGVIEAAASGVDVPREHLTNALARPVVATAAQDLVAIHSAAKRPREASVAVKHRGWWFFVDGRDGRSKRGFMILRTLIGMRLDAAPPGQGTPLLTVPVNR